MKDIAVIGLGKFGRSVACHYAAYGGTVLAIDNDADKVQDIADEVTYAVKADMTDTDAVRALGLSNMDVAVVAIADNMEASVMATILSKEEGVPFVIAKAQNEIHGKVLEKVGADRVIYPEFEMGARIARNLKVDHLTDLIDLSDEYSIVEAQMPKSWIGKTLMDINPRKKYGINIIGYRFGGRVDVRVEPNMPLTEEMVLVAVGENAQLDRAFS